MASHAVIRTLRASLEIPKQRRIRDRAGHNARRIFRPQWDLFEDRTLLSLLATTTTLTPSVQSPLYGTPEMFTATVAPVSAGTGVPTGTVVFSDGSTPLGTAPLNTAAGISTATFTTTALTLGSQSVTAVYSGDSEFAGSASGEITTYAGSNTYGDGGLATAAALDNPTGLAVDAAGDLFIADSGHNLIREVIPGPDGLSDGTITTVAVTGLSDPTGLAVDSADNLFIADTGNQRILEVTPGPGENFSVVTIITVAVPGYPLISPTGVAVNAQGDRLFIADSNGVTGATDDAVYGVTPGSNGFSAGTTVTVAARTSPTNPPAGLAVDSAGDNLFVTESGNHAKVLEVSPRTGGDYSNVTITTVGLPDVYDLAGAAMDSNGNLFVADEDTSSVIEVTPVCGANYSNVTFTPVASIALGDSSGVALDAAGDLFVADTFHNQILEVAAASGGTFSSVAAAVVGNGSANSWGDGGPATAAGLENPTGVAIDSAGDLFIADSSNNAIREVRPDGTITTVVGPSGGLNYPTGVAVDAHGDLFIADTLNNVIREVTPGPDGLLDDGTITTVAGNGSPGYRGDGGLATAAELDGPTSVAVDGHGDLFIGDTVNDSIREVTPGSNGYINATITTVYGDGPPSGGPTIYGGPPGGNDTFMYPPIGVAVDSQGDLFFVAPNPQGYFYENNEETDTVLERRPDGTITTVAGNGIPGYSGDGAQATAAELFNPAGLAVDSAEDLFIADSGNDRIREVQPDGIITTVAGNGTFGYGGDNGPGPAAALFYPESVAVDGSGDLYIADLLNNRIRQVTGTMSVTIRAVTPTTAAVVATPAIPLFGQPVTLTATVSSAYNGVIFPTVFPTGTATFYDGGTELGTGSLATTDGVTSTALTTTAMLSVGSHALTVVYAGDPGFQGSETGSALTVLPDPTTTAITCNIASPLFGQPETFTAAVAPASPLAGSPAGMVVFYDGAVNTADQIGSGALRTTNGIATATLTTAALAVGSHSVTAVYNGDFDFTASVSRTISAEAGNGPGGSLYNPSDVAVDKNGDLFIADTPFNSNDAVLEVTPDGTINTVVSNTGGYGDPVSVVLDGQGDLFVGYDSGLIQEVTPGPDGSLLDGFLSTFVYTNAFPTGMVFDSAGDMFIANANSNDILEATPVGTVTTVIYGGYDPSGLAMDGQGDLFIADLGDNVVREVVPGPDGLLSDGTTSIIAGNGTAGYTGDGGAATGAELNAPGGVAVDAEGDVFIADTGNSVIREVTPDGIIATIAGNGTAGYSGDGGPATDASLSLNSDDTDYPNGLAVDSSGNLFISDSGNGVIRRAGGLLLNVQPVNTANLGAALNGSQQGSVTLETTSNSAVSMAVQAISGLSNPNPANPETITLDLGGATTTPTAPINTSSGVQVDLTSSGGNAAVQGATVSGGTVVIDSSVAPADWTVDGGNVTVEGSATAGDFIVNGGTVTLADGTVITGNSPAITVNAGTVILAGVTAQTATNSPTIVVNGGTLIARDSTIEESTGYTQAAILITGGTVDLGTAASPGGNTFNVNGTGTLIQNTTGIPVPAAGDTFTNNGTAVAYNFGTVGLSAPSAQTANQGVPHAFNLGSLTDTVNDSQSWMVDVNWGDGSSDTDFGAKSTGSLSTQSHTFALPGTYTVTVTATDPIVSGATAWDFDQTIAVSVPPSIFVLDPSAGGALSLSGNASLKIPGAVVVDSSSSSALSASGNAQIKASVIDVHGGVQKSGNASFSPAPTTGAAALPDPLASLAEPSTSGLTNYGSESLSGNSSATIKPGIYSQISVSGQRRADPG